MSGVVESLVVAGFVGFGSFACRELVRQNRKLDRMANYLFQAKPDKFGIPAPVGKITQIDETLKDHGLQLKKLDEGQVEILRQLKTQNGHTIGQAVQALAD